MWFAGVGELEMTTYSEEDFEKIAASIENHIDEVAHLQNLDSFRFPAVLLNFAMRPIRSGQNRSLTWTPGRQIIEPFT